MASTRGRQVVVPLTNKSGGAIIAGDVVVIDTANDTAFTTTTTGQAEITVGIAQESIASNATGRVLVAGYAALVNVPSSMTRGRYLETHTVVKQATGSATRRAGSFGQFLTAGTTPTAVLWGITDQTASGTSTPTFVGCRVTRSATKSISNSTDTLVDFDSESNGGFDTDAFHDTVTNNSRLTVPAAKGGKYRIWANVEWQANSTGSRQIYVILNANGTTTGTIVAIQQLPGMATDEIRMGLSTTYALAAGDYVELRCSQKSGGSLGLNAVANFAPNFGMELLGT